MKEKILNEPTSVWGYTADYCYLCFVLILFLLFFIVWGKNKAARLKSFTTFNAANRVNMAVKKITHWRYLFLILLQLKKAESKTKIHFLKNV